MKFWSDVEKEYNELLGEAPSGHDDDDKEIDDAGEFNDLMSNIKKDLKKIPKSEVFPSLTSDNKEEENVEAEESDLEHEDGRRTFSRKSKKNKKCLIGGKTYEVGERWKDEKTGKDMMCILMSIPKSVQPLLAEVDILSKPSPENEAEWKRPSVEPQWSYTATPKKKDQCEEVTSKHPSEKPDKIETLYEGKNKSSKYQKESNKEEQELESQNEAARKEEPNDQKEKKESSSETQSEKTDTGPKIIVVDPPEPKKDDASSSEDEDKSEKASKQNPDVRKSKEKEPNKEEEEDAEEEESEDGSDMEEDDDKPKSQVNDKLKKSKTEEPKENKYVSSSSTEPLKENNVSSDATASSQRMEKDSNIRDENPNSDQSNDLDNSKINNQDLPDSQESIGKEERGEPIYTKETVVVQRKLIKTEKTIETTETEKNKK